ncbi:hypothetical protein [Mycolicibacterium neoaurum]|uniref:hypothetical protein n=1 Tax=Mycolicibacterium neoaurum TaxID=1795 RepID=UPI001F1F5F06|nr:hypothetical protein [Mycolicibacterium neoaurum]
MTESYAPPRVHVVVGSPWRDAVFALLGAPLRPWSAVADVARGDGVLVVVDCSPQLVLTGLAVVGDDADVPAAIAREAHSRFHLSVAKLPEVAAELGWAPTAGDVIVGDRVPALMGALEVHRRKDSGAASFGHSTQSAARTLLTSGGCCAGCLNSFDLRSAAGREAVAVRTADDTRVTATVAGRLTLVRADWPAALCRECRNSLQDSSFLDFKFAQHPRCPQCEGQRTAAASFGMPVFPTMDLPWVDQRGCCVTPDDWTCRVCGHEW